MGRVCIVMRAAGARVRAVVGAGASSEERFFMSGTKLRISFPFCHSTCSGSFGSTEMPPPGVRPTSLGSVPLLVCTSSRSQKAFFSPWGFRRRLAGPPLLVTAVHLSRRMAIADWLVRCVHIFDDRQRIFKKLELWLLLTG